MKNKLIPTYKFDTDITIVPLYDLHVGSPDFDEEGFMQTVS